MPIYNRSTTSAQWAALRRRLEEKQAAEERARQQKDAEAAAAGEGLGKGLGGMFAGMGGGGKAPAVNTADDTIAQQLAEQKAAREAERQKLLLEQAQREAENREAEDAQIADADKKTSWRVKLMHGLAAGLMSYGGNNEGAARFISSIREEAQMKQQRKEAILASRTNRADAQRARLLSMSDGDFDREMQYLQQTQGRREDQTFQERQQEKAHKFGLEEIDYRDGVDDANREDEQQHEAGRDAQQQAYAVSRLGIGAAQDQERDKQKAINDKADKFLADYGDELSPAEALELADAVINKKPVRPELDAQVQESRTRIRAERERQGKLDAIQATRGAETALIDPQTGQPKVFGDKVLTQPVDPSQYFPQSGAPQEEQEMPDPAAVIDELVQETGDPQKAFEEIIRRQRSGELPNEIAEMLVSELRRRGGR